MRCKRGQEQWPGARRKTGCKLQAFATHLQRRGYVAGRRRKGASKAQLREKLRKRGPAPSQPQGSGITSRPRAKRKNGIAGYGKEAISAAQNSGYRLVGSFCTQHPVHRVRTHCWAWGGSGIRCQIQQVTAGGFSLTQHAGMHAASA